MTELSPKHMETVDRLWWSPSERAQGVMAIINSVRKTLTDEGVDPSEIPSDLDILCFASEYIAKEALVIQDDDLMDIAVALNQWLYARHYTQPGKLYGPPDKLQAESKEGEDAAPHSEERKEDPLSGSNGRGSIPRGTQDHEEEQPTDGDSGEDRTGNDTGSGEDSGESEDGLTAQEWLDAELVKQPHKPPD